MELESRLPDEASLAAARRRIAQARKLRDSTDIMELRAATDLLVEAAATFDLAALPVEFGSLHLDLADTLNLRARLGDPDVLDEAIDCYQKSIVVFNRDEFPEAFARAFHGLGLANWAGGQLEAARWCFETVLEALSPDVSPLEHARARANVAAVLAATPEAQARAQAVAIYESVLDAVSADTHPAEQARFLLALGQTRRVQLEGSRQGQLEAAVSAFTRAADVAGAGDRSDMRAAALAEAALTQVELTALDPTRFDDAKQAFDLALGDIPAEAQPDRHAELRLGFGRLWAGRLPAGDELACDAALTHFEAAIALAPRVSTAALVAPALIEAPRIMVEGPARTQAHVARAIEISRHALSAWPRAQFPTEYARVNLTLGSALLASAAGDRTSNVREAIEAFEAGLDAVNRDAEPVAYASLQVALAEALAARTDGDRADNVRRAAAAANRALEASDEDRAVVGRANHLLGRLALETGGASPQALAEGAAHLYRALEDRPRETDPVAHAETQMLLGMILASQAARGEPHLLGGAIEAYRASAGAYDVASHPRESASVHFNLAVALMQPGSGAQDLEEAVRSFEVAAQVFDAAAYPQQHAMITGNLAQARSRLKALA
ncbi:MAG: hypothetical protein OXR64_06175 [Chloroflexota bacterium]|nr:hypothetical protein [Chloroflexota bacterium]MDE2919419.1 hypothetical protein [Chloroflexota bacterium]